MPLRQRPFYPNGGDIVNALEAGCKGDGVTDDTAALQAAINAHQIVFIPWGTYLLSQTIQVCGPAV
jgi:polygalacturonase